MAKGNEFTWCKAIFIDFFQWLHYCVMRALNYVTIPRDAWANRHAGINVFTRVAKRICQGGTAGMMIIGVFGDGLNFKQTFWILA